MRPLDTVLLVIPNSSGDAVCWPQLCDKQHYTWQLSSPMSPFFVAAEVNIHLHNCDPRQLPQIYPVISPHLALHTQLRHNIIT
ncbi:hypothetical protein E2C01_027573 [Portunus trituberculatus]|uniref:Uncharacterized protein n=1 Tax=Portunus trituberculatus TaxID=210409 RepID=A0A5B7EMB9_PORTR|nr:hypothetical protein [Portunus trituberculatus]